MFKLIQPEGVIIYEVDGNEILRFKPDHRAMINKFDDVFGLLNTFLKNHDVFAATYTEFVQNYANAPKSQRCNVTMQYVKRIDSILRFIYNTGRFYELVPKQEVVKDSVYHITHEEIIEIIKVSLTFRSIIFTIASNIAMRDFEKKQVRDEVLDNLYALGTISKLFKIITSLIFTTIQQSRKSNSKKSIWSVLTSTFGYSPAGYSIELFNNIIYRALPSVRLDCNPVIYFVSLVKEKIKFLLRRQYQYTLNEGEFEPGLITHKADLEEQIIYKAIIQNLLVEIIATYKDYISVLRCNGNIIFKNISCPIVSRILNMPLSKLMLPNLQVFNFLVHNIVTNSHVKYKYIPRLLLACGKLNTVTDLQNNEKEKQLTKLIRAEVDRLKLNQLSQFRKSAFVKIAKNTINMLLSQDYFDGRSRQKISIDKNELITEYLSFVYDFLTGKFDDQINKWREHLYSHDLGGQKIDSSQLQSTNETEDELYINTNSADKVISLNNLS